MFLLWYGASALSPLNFAEISRCCYETHYREQGCWNTIGRWDEMDCHRELDDGGSKKISVFRTQSKLHFSSHLTNSLWKSNLIYKSYILIKFVKIFCWLHKRIPNNRKQIFEINWKKYGKVIIFCKVLENNFAENESSKIDQWQLGNIYFGPTLGA